MKSLPYLLFLTGIVALFFYSFTQIDLSLTLTRASFWQEIQKMFQYIGYFNRPLSTGIFVVIVAFLFFLYAIFLRLAYLGKLDRKKVWLVIIVSSVILSFSYTAFSYDIFNYIFDAKIVTHYGDNPYFQKALDYPGDPMLSFMHWTHRTYPYGPFWLVLTVPLSFIGAGYFLLTYFLFKFLSTGFFLGTAYLIEKILEKENSKFSTFGLVFFALNPLVIIESLVSSHNDVAIMFFVILGVYFLFSRKKVLSLVVLIGSILIKFFTIVLIVPFFLKSFGIFKKWTDDLDKFSILCLLFLTAGLGYVLTKMEMQPWYFLWIVSFVALIKPRGIIVALAFGLSVGLVLRYGIFLYQGDWNGIAQNYKLLVTLITPVISVVVFSILKRTKQIQKIV
ncbi:MAG: DUF2029 domain-containing protein [Candidatus Levybacteria bacterium]|nr:DUF2029 domain-containing protein [Candidatus Levybacteria bacterium]